MTPQDRSRRSRTERRQQILTQARRCFAEHGYRATTPEQVAAAANVRASVFVKDYPEKCHLVRDLMEELANLTLRSWRSETAELADPHMRLLALADRLLVAARTHAEAFRAVSRILLEGAEDGAIAPIKAFAVEWEDFLAELIAQGQQSGFFRRSLNPRVGAWTLIHAAMAGSLTAGLGVVTHQQQEYSNQAIECALHCLLKTDV